MRQYLDLLKLIKNKGVYKDNRTGIGTFSIFGHQMRFDLNDGFPLITTKKMFLKGVIYELLWFLKGSTNIKYLVDNGVKIWNEWADENGELGPVYGAQWRRWKAVEKVEASPVGYGYVPEHWRPYNIDQISQVIEQIKNNPNSRRHIVSAWNVGEIEKMALPPCHLLFQFDVTDGRLSCQLYQRSCDVFLGVPFNIASYSLLTMMVAQVCDLKLGDFVWTGGDCHIYENHLNQVDEQLFRAPRKLPTMCLNPDRKDIDSFVYEDFKLEGYNPHPAIKAPIAV